MSSGEAAKSMAELKVAPIRETQVIVLPRPILASFISELE
jgi:hypothetical protein